MKKTLVYVVIIVLALYAKVCFASDEGVIYTQNFEQFTESADGSAAPDGLSVLNSQGIHGGSGVYAAEEAFKGWSLIKTNAESGNVSLMYNFADSASVSFVYEASIVLHDKNADRTITVTNGEEAVNIVSIKKNGYIYAGESRIYSFNTEIGKVYKIKASYTPASGRVTLRVMYDGREYIAQGTAALQSQAVKAVGIVSVDAADSQIYIDNIRILYTYEDYELLFADNFDMYNNSSATSSSRWPKGNIAYGADSSEEYGGNLKVTKTVTNDANIETALYTSGHYTGEGNVHYSLSLKFDDFNCERRLTVRDSSPTTSYKYAYPLGYIDTNGCLYWGGTKQDYVFGTDVWYDITIVFNRISGDCSLTVSDALTTFICKADKVRNGITLTRMGIEFRGLSGESSVTYIDNVSLWLKPAADDSETKTNLYESELNTLSSISGVDTTGRATVIDGSSVIELKNGEYINCQSGASAEAFVADLYINAPVSISVTGDGSELVSFTSDFKIKAGSSTLGTYTNGRTYRIIITNNSGANRYISVMENKSRLVGFVKLSAAHNGAIKLTNSLNKAYIDTIGFAENEKTVYPINILPKDKTNTSGSFAEFIFPQCIDGASVTASVNGKAVQAELSGDRTIRINNLSPDSYYSITITGFDLMGNRLNANASFNTLMPKADIKFSYGTLKTGINPIRVILE